MTNKPEVVAWEVRTISNPNTQFGTSPSYPGWAEKDPDLSITPLVSLSDYEVLRDECERWKRGSEIRDEQNQDLHSFIMELKAECEELRTALAESRANDLTAMGYLNQIRGLVGGDDFPDMVERVAKLQAECEKLRAAMIEAKGHINHYMYGGSSYREPAAKAIKLIDAAMEGDKP